MVVKSGRFAPVNAAMKRLFACIAALALLCSLVLAGCGSSPSSSTSANDAQGSATASSQTAEQPGESIEAKVTITDAEGQTTSYTVQVPAAEATVLAALEATDAEAVIEDSQYGKYITTINGIAAAGNSGWVYTVNGEQVMDAVDVCPVAAGDTVEFSFITM
ncbi:MAG: DUF4430 domain-containing protein [Coriobacteriales bacterium]